MTAKKKTTAKAASGASKAETESKAAADALLKDPTSKTEVDKAAAELLTGEKTGDGKTLASEITAANQAGKTTGDVSEEAKKAAQAAFDADERRQSEQIANANAVNDAKTLVERSREQGIASDAEKAAAERIATDEAASSKIDRDEVLTQEQANAKAEKLLSTPYSGKADKVTEIGIIEGEQGQRYRHTVTQTPDGRVSQALNPHEANAPVETAKAIL